MHAGVGSCPTTTSTTSSGGDGGGSSSTAGGPFNDTIGTSGKHSLTDDTGAPRKASKPARASSPQNVATTGDDGVDGAYR